MPLTQEQFDLVTDCLSFLDTDREKMNEFEINFLTGKGPNDQYDSLEEKFAKYGEEIKLSEKQLGVLERLYRKIALGEKPSFGR